jgi:hypothetical protein
VSGRAIPLPAVVLGGLGLALIAFETVQSLRSVAINALGTTLIFLGVGLFVIAAVLVVVGLTTTDAGDPASGEAGEAPHETLQRLSQQ